MSQSFSKVRSARDRRAQDALGNTGRESSHIKHNRTLPVVHSAHLETTAVVTDEQALLAENKMIESQLETTSDAIQETAKKLEEVAELQARFAAAVQVQSEKIDELHKDAADSTGFVVQGGESLRRALNRGANFRVVVMAVLLMMSFALLFLDWYIP